MARAETPTSPDLVARFAGVKAWKRGGERAPHKPLLLLWALARLQRGEPRLAPFAEVDEQLGHLLREFGRPRKSYHPEYPFWHLQSDGLWVIPERDVLEDDLARRRQKNNLPKRVLLTTGARGGLPPDVDAELRSRPDVVNDIAQELLARNFPPSLHDDLLNAVGMPWIVVKTCRDPEFRTTILRIYEHRCAVCGYDGRLGDSDLGLEAAHVRWHAAGGPDAPDNGVALCSFHHKAFDRGAIGLDDDLRVLVSQDVHGSRRVDEWLLRFAGAPLGRPLHGEPPPAPLHLGWHRREVFRGPARAVGA